jgi:hypothetical protein
MQVDIRMVQQKRPHGLGFVRREVISDDMNVPALWSAGDDLAEEVESVRRTKLLRLTDLIRTLQIARTFPPARSCLDFSSRSASGVLSVIKQEVCAMLRRSREGQSEQ